MRPRRPRTSFRKRRIDAKVLRPKPGRQKDPLRRTPLDIALGRWSLDNSRTYIANDLTSRLFSPYDLNRHGPTRCATFSPKASISRGFRARRSPCLSPPPTCAPGADASSATPTCRPTCCSPRPACRRCFRSSPSETRPIGTAAIPREEGRSGEHQHRRVVQEARDEEPPFDHHCLTVNE
jgi:hypothetical protein